LAISVVASRVTPAQDGPINYQERSAWSSSDMILGPRQSACSVTVRWLRDSPKKPHAAPPADILSVWQIKENPVGNDLLIIVNSLINLPPFLPTVAQAPFCGQQ
jgi:hypothetical protein